MQDAVDRHSTHRLDIQLGDGLTVGNNGQGLQGRPTQSPGFFLQQNLDVFRVIRRGAKLVATGHLGKENTAACILVFAAQERYGWFDFCWCHTNDF